MGNNLDLEEQAIIGIKEAIGWHTVAIDVSLGSKNKPDWGTGSLVTIKGRSFIITCGHVVKPAIKNEDLRFLYRSEKAFQTVEKALIKRISTHILYQNLYKTFPKKIPIVNRFYSDGEDDVVLLEVDPSSSEISLYNFYEIKDLDVLTPEVDSPAYYMGFSRELTRNATIDGDIGIFPFFGLSYIIGKDIDARAYNPDRHFLIDFKTFDNDDFNIDPFGLSGCGVWSRTPSGPDKLWTPNIYLVGVQNSYFRRSEVLKATKIERIIPLVN
jgi:hypothetical protein